MAVLPGRAADAAIRLGSELLAQRVYAWHSGASRTTLACIVWPRLELHTPQVPLLEVPFFASMNLRCAKLRGGRSSGRCPERG